MTTEEDATLAKLKKFLVTGNSSPECHGGEEGLVMGGEGVIDSIVRLG